MPDMIPVGNTIRPPDPSAGINTISGMMGIRQQQQALQTGAQVLAQEKLKTNQQQGVQDFFQTWDPSDHVADDGTTDLDSALQSPQFKGAGNAKPAIMQSLLDIKNKQLSNKQALSTLNSDLLKQLGTGVGALAKDEDVVADKTDPATGVNAGRAKVDQYLANYAKLSPDAARVAAIYAPITKHAPPGKLAAGVASMQLQAQSASEQQGQQNPIPGAIDTGANIQPTVTPRATGVPQLTGQSFQRQVPPGANVVTDAYGRQFILNPATNQVTPVGSGAAPGAPPGASRSGPSFTQPVADQANALAELREARAATSQGGVTRNVNQHLLDLSQDTRTGPGTHAVQNLAAALGMASGSRYQEISAYLDRQAALQAQVMGVPNTNAGLAAAERATGTTEYTPQALREKVKFFDALNSGAMAYRQGLDKAVGTGPTPDLSKYQAFRSAWTQNFDPDVFRAEDALRRGDKEELASLKKRLGAKGMSDLATKSANLRQLENGVIPGG